MFEMFLDIKLDFPNIDENIIFINITNEIPNKNDYQDITSESFLNL